MLRIVGALPLPRVLSPIGTHDDTGIEWSPDGASLALSCQDSNLRLIDPSGETITEFYACADPISAPEWSPDKTRIAFACPYIESAGKNDIFVIDISDDNATRFTIRDGHYPRPGWSPHATPLFTAERDDVQPAWSPDGTKIAFASNRDGDYEIYVLDLERAP